jgi:hypothetical protein
MRRTIVRNLQTSITGYVLQTYLTTEPFWAISRKIYSSFYTKLDRGHLTFFIGSETILPLFKTSEYLEHTVYSKQQFRGESIH